MYALFRAFNQTDERKDLSQLGIRETRRPEEVDEVLTKTPGTVMVIVNSVCGCAAGKARPGVAIALKHNVVPDAAITVFAGADIEATDRARSYFKGFRPSSPSIGLLKNGELLYILERHQIEGRTAPEIADLLTGAFDKYCAPVQEQSVAG